MQQLETRLFVFWDDNSTFKDLSDDAQDYSRDDFSLELNSSEDYLYIGYKKPINTVFVEMNTDNETSNTFTFEYYNGTAFTALSSDQFLDETKGFTRSGFLTWERNLTDEDTTTVNSQEAYWYRLRPDSNHDTGTRVQGINIVFSDDNDIKNVVPSITDVRFLSEGKKSHILSHVASRNEIVQELRNSGKFKFDFNTGKLKDFNAFDLLRVSQLREASKWKALELIFSDLSDATEDFYDLRARKYSSRYNGAIKTFFLNVDVDDDGIEDGGEELADNTAKVIMS